MRISRKNSIAYFLSFDQFFHLSIQLSRFEYFALAFAENYEDLILNELKRKNLSVLYFDLNKNLCETNTDRSTTYTCLLILYVLVLESGTDTTVLDHHIENIK